MAAFDYLLKRGIVTGGDYGSKEVNVDMVVGISVAMPFFEVYEILSIPSDLFLIIFACKSFTLCYTYF